MATKLTLFCLAIDNQKGVIGNVFKVKVQSDDDASDLRDVIKAEKAPRLDYLAANRLIVWKLLKPLHIRGMEDKNSLDATIKGIELPDPESNQALHGNGTVQLLCQIEELSKYWEVSPKKGHLHIVVQVPRNFLIIIRLPHMSDNNPAIERLGSINIDRVRETADHLYSTLWKKPLNSILANIDVPGPQKSYMYVPQDQLSNLGVEHLGYNEKALLFRHEYSLALEEIEEQSKMRREYLSGGIIITGDPGLGKTCFLLYLLFHCLSNGRPTVFQFLPECFVLFTDSGAEVYSHRSIILPDETWALADSNAENPLPCHSFLRACKKHHAFIVQTSSPDQRRYRAWSKEYHARIYVMDCFPLTESIALGMTHGFSVRLIKDHCKKWGPSARIMMNLMTDPGEIRGHTERVKDAALHFAKHFDDFTRQDKVNAMAISHTLFTIRPKGLPSEERSSAIGRIESSYLNRFVIEAIVTQDVLQQIEFYNLVSRHPWFRGSAGYMFEMAVLSWLCANSESNELPCTPARSASPQLTIPVCQGW